MLSVKGTMRSATTSAITFSVVVHGAVIAALAFRSHDAVELTEPEPPEVEVSIEPAPVEVALVDDSAGAIAALPPEVAPKREPAPLPPSSPAAKATRRSSAATTRGAASSSSSEPHATTGTDQGKAMMKMRQGPDVNMSLSPDLMAKLANREGQLELPPKPSGWLDPKSGGRFHIDDEVAQVDVHKDGSVHMTDKPEFDAHWDLPSPDLRFIGAWWEEMRRDPEAFTRAGPTQELPAHEQAVPGTWNSGTNGNPDGNPIPQNHGEGGGGIPILGGHADVTAWAMRKFGHTDPYAARKLKLLDDTRDERVYQGGRFRADQLRRSAELMRTNLEQLWRGTQDPAARREALFEMWDECGEGDGQLGEAGERARVQVLGWIRAKLPKGNPGQFSTADIEAFDRKRQSKQHFVPYE